MIGGIIGDVVGSVYEAYQWQRKDLPLFQSLPLETSNDLICLFKTNTKWKRTQYYWTDDTLCTLALYHAYIHQQDPVNSLVYFCKKYRSESIGFGGAFTSWLDNPVPYGSYANGAIMRIGFVPYLNLSLPDKLQLAQDYTNISHNHPDSLMAVNIFVEVCDYLHHINNSLSLEQIDDKVSERVDQQVNKTTNEQVNKNVKENLYKEYLKTILLKHNYHETVETLHNKKSFEMNALTTIMQSLVIVYESNSIEEVLRNTFYVGGDCDTLACIACNIASHLYVLPEDLLSFSLTTLQQYPDLNELVEHFQQHHILSTSSI